MITPEVLDYKDAIPEELYKQRGWIMAHIDPSMAWPVRTQRIVYLGQEYWIIPVTNDAYPAVAVRSNEANDNDLRERILRFLSVLSWIQDSGVSLISFGGGSHLHAYSRPKGGGLMISKQFDLRYLPEVIDPKARLALALMREARGLKHIAYSFLTFWRILEVAVGKKRIQTWAAGAIGRLTNRSAKEAIGKIQESGVEDISKHLYVSGRCAVAHAGNNPIIDPDQPEDSWRLAREKPLVEALAVLAVEENLGVKTSSTIYREHLYELGGFKRIFGDEIVKIALEKGDIAEETNIDLPVIDIGLMNKEPFKAFIRLQPATIGYEDGIIYLVFARPDSRFQVQFALNFHEERLEFDIHNAVFGIPDDGSPDWADIKADMNDFLKWYYLNGCLTITDSETGELIARKDEFIPMNVFVEPKAFDEETAKLRALAEQRRASDQNDAQSAQRSDQ